VLGAVFMFYALVAYPIIGLFMKSFLCLWFALHQVLIGSRPDDFTCTNSSCLPNMRKISLKGAGNAGRAV
jgi:hypothetical protein